MRRVKTRTPIGMPSRSIGTPSIVRAARRSASSAQVNSGSAMDIRDMNRLARSTHGAAQQSMPRPAVNGMVPHRIPDVRANNRNSRQ